MSNAETEELFDDLEIHFPHVIAQMDNTFTTHEFIEKLSQPQLELYIQLLSEYNEKEPPFQAVHLGIVQRLKDNWAHLVQQVGTESENTFGNYYPVAIWRKVEY
jgi:hypothetical protein